MTAQNHALAGTIIGLTVANPLVALPMAFLSHFVLDAIPHYDPPGKDVVARLRSRRFVVEFLVLGGLLCFLVVLWLYIARPERWLAACFAAFLATSPDFMWLPRYINSVRHGKSGEYKNFITKFHSRIQWKTGPELWWVELIWFIVGTWTVAKLIG